MHARCAGLDISKKDAKVCVRVAGAGRRKTVETVTTWSSMTSRVLALQEHLATEQVTCVVMEATGDYWKPFYYLLEDLPGVEVVLVNARHVKNLPGRKTDVADATWLAQLGAHGLVRGSFVPPEPIRQLRDLTRTRTSITRERSREIQRLEKLLEDAGIKLSAVATDIVGVSGRAMIEALIAGDRDASRMADLAQRRMRVKIPQLTEALVGRFNEHHAFLARVHLDLIDQHTAKIDQITERVELMMEPLRGFHDLICTIPGIGTRTADVVVAETGADMSRFPTAKHLASLGRHDPWEQRVCGKGEVKPDPSGQPLSPGRARSLGDVDRAHTRDVSQRQIPTDRDSPRTAEGQRRHPAHPPCHDLAHGSDGNALRRPGVRLLHPSAARSSPPTRHPSARDHGLPRHARSTLTSLVALTTPAWLQ